MTGSSLISRHLSLITKIRDVLANKGIDGFLVTDITNVRYMTGFTGSSGFLMINEKRNIFFTDFRYKEQAEKEIAGWEISIEKGERQKTVINTARTFNINRLGVEASITYEFYKKLTRKGIRLKPVKSLVEEMRKIKDEHEMTLIKKAITRAESAFRDIKPYIKAGIKEKEIALRLEEALKKRGCKTIPFDIIVAAGRNSSMPHAKVTERKLKAGDLVVIDWGGEAGGYFSDITRTFLIKGGNIDRKCEIYSTVLKANMKAIASIRDGIKSKRLDSIVRDFIKKAGYGEYFGHGTGHGIGLSVHEAPHISWTGSEVIRSGMVFTIEPGIYITGLGGVRIEDIVMVKPDCPIILTSLPKELEIIN
ncbi:MAG: aminopeptidase P family protein [Nitrospirae bacterium]|nr:aminopeptidase P family protein [Nitrospirota bacterium]